MQTIIDVSSSHTATFTYFCVDLKFHFIETHLKPIWLAIKGFWLETCV